MSNVIIKSKLTAVLLLHIFGYVRAPGVRVKNAIAMSGQILMFITDNSLQVRESSLGYVTGNGG